MFCIGHIAYNTAIPGNFIINSKNKLIKKKDINRFLLLLHFLFNLIVLVRRTVSLEHYIFPRYFYRQRAFREMVTSLHFHKEYKSK